MSRRSTRERKAKPSSDLYAYDEDIESDSNDEADDDEEVVDVKPKKSAKKTPTPRKRKAKNEEDEVADDDELNDEPGDANEESGPTPSSSSAKAKAKRAKTTTREDVKKLSDALKRVLKRLQPNLEAVSVEKYTERREVNNMDDAHMMLVSRPPPLSDNVFRASIPFKALLFRYGYEGKDLSQPATDQMTDEQVFETVKNRFLKKSDSNSIVNEEEAAAELADIRQNEEQVPIPNDVTAQQVVDELLPKWWRAFLIVKRYYWVFTCGKIRPQLIDAMMDHQYVFDTFNKEKDRFNPTNVDHLSSNPFGGL